MTEPKIGGNVPKQPIAGGNAVEQQKPVVQVGKHTIQLGDNPPINLKSLGSNNIPFQGFKTASRITSELRGMTNVARNVLGLLQRSEGALDVPELLREINTFEDYTELYMRSSGAGGTKLEKELIARMAPAVQSLSNIELETAYGTLCSNELCDLKDALAEVAAMDPDMMYRCNSYLGMLTDLEGLVVSEVSRRYYAENASPEELLQMQTLSQSHETSDASLANDEAQVTERGEKDATATSMASVVEAQAGSVMSLDEAKKDYETTIGDRIENPADFRRVGDFLRSQELTININPKLLFKVDKDGYLLPDQHGMPMDDPGFSLMNCFMLQEKGVEQSKNYMDYRREAENEMFPELGNGLQAGKAHPIYGAMNTIKQLAGSCASYGNAVIVMKPHVKHNATYSYGDTLNKAAVHIEPGNEKLFIDELKKRSGILSEENKAKVFDDNSDFRKEIHKFFQADMTLPMEEVVQKRLVDTAASILTANRLDPKDENASFDLRYLLQACLMVTCGDRQQNGGHAASFEHIETLLAHMDECDKVVQAINAAPDQQRPMKFRGAQYIEAQIHQPIDLARDVAEIRLSGTLLPEDPKECEKIKEEIIKWNKKTGVAVTFYSYYKDRASVNSFNKNDASMTKQLTELCLKEHEEYANTLLKNTFDNLDAAAKNYIGKREKPAELKKLLGDLHFFSGRFLDVFKKSLTDDVMAKAAQFLPNGEKDLSAIVKEELFKRLKVKTDLLEEIVNKPDEYKFDNDEQRHAFVTWVMQSAALKSPNEMKFLYDTSKAMMGLMNNVFDKDMTEEKFLQSLKALADDLDGKIAKYKETLPKRVDFGYDDISTELSRTVFLGLAMLQAKKDAPEQLLPGLQNAIRTPFMMAFRKQAAAYDTFIDQVNTWKIKGNKELTDAVHAYLATEEGHDQKGHLLVLSQLLEVMDMELATKAGEQPVNISRVEPQEIPTEMRYIFNDVFPDIGAIVDKFRPCTLRRISNIAQPANGFPKPQGLAGRRSFLLRCLPTYRDHERKFDKGDVHGRSHAIRAFIFSNVLGNIIKEKGVNVDVDSLAMATAGHDMGRAGNGVDVYEEQSAEAVCKVMSSLAEKGQTGPGEQYLQDVGKTITSKEQDAPTIEAYLLHSADSLDYTRVGDIDLKYFPFLREGIILNGVYLPPDDKLRRALVKEAEHLAYLTHPICGMRVFGHQLLMTGKGEDAKMFQKMVTDITNCMQIKNEQDSDEKVLGEIETLIRSNPTQFPLLNKYYKD